MALRIIICRSNSISPDPRVEKEARALARLGYPVAALGWDKTGELPAEEHVQGVHIYRLSLRARPRRGLGNLFAELRWQVRLLGWLVRHRSEYDAIHACDFDTLLPGLVCQRLWKKKVVYDIFDFYADMLRLTPAPIVKVVRALEIKAIGWADAVILADERRTQQIAGSRPKRCTVIYNSPEEENLAALEAPHPPPAGSQLHIAYVGTLQIERGLLVLLEVLRRHPEWSLSLAGYGPDEERIVGEARQLPNVTWHGRVSYPCSLQLSRDADVLLATYDVRIPNHRYSSPNKVFEAMLLGKPIIVARDTNMDRVVDQAGCGLVIHYGVASELEQALLRLQREPDLRRQLGARARQAYETTYGWQHMQNRLLELYRSVAGS